MSSWNNHDWDNDDWKNRKHNNDWKYGRTTTGSMDDWSGGGRTTTGSMGSKNGEWWANDHWKHGSWKKVYDHTIPVFSTFFHWEKVDGKKNRFQASMSDQYVRPVCQTSMSDQFHAGRTVHVTVSPTPSPHAQKSIYVILSCSQMQ